MGEGASAERPHAYQGAIWIVGSFAIAVALLAAGYIFNRHRAEDAARESRRSDYAQCVIANEDRAANRKIATLNYTTLADRLRYDPPRNKRLVRSWNHVLVGYETLLKAQRPIKCDSYVRPELPPDTG